MEWKLDSIIEKTERKGKGEPKVLFTCNLKRGDGSKASITTPDTPFFEKSKIGQDLSLQ